MIGTRLGNYQLLECIGAGGMGAVYVAEHRTLGRRAAVKVLLPELVARQEAVDRFFQEARAIAAIPDPGVVQIFDFGHEAGSAYLVMELLAGESLEARLRRMGRLPARDAVRVARQVATTLAAAHAAGIVHRDIKPDNLYVVRDPEAESGERVKVLDFGIAKLAGGTGTSSRTSTGVVMGTPLYMSPEQCRGAGGVDLRADVYALGCVLFHLVCGRPPFECEGAGEVIARHLLEPAPRAASVNPAVPAELDAIIARCLEKAPEARFADMPALAAALGALSTRLTGRDVVASVQPTVFAPAPTTLGLSTGASDAGAPVRKRGKGGWVAGALVSVAAIAGAVVLIASRVGGSDAEPSEPAHAAVEPQPVPQPQPQTQPVPQTQPLPLPPPQPPPPPPPQPPPQPQPQPTKPTLTHKPYHPHPHPHEDDPYAHP